MSIEVVVDKTFPYESTNPERPGVVHAAIIDGKLVCSPRAFNELKKLSDRGPDAFDIGFFDLLRSLK